MFQVHYPSGQVRVADLAAAVCSFIPFGSLGCLEVGPEMNPGPDPEVGVSLDLLPLEAADAADEAADVKVWIPRFWRSQSLELSID